MLTLAQLRSTLTASAALEMILAWMQALGFETTAWQDGRIQKTIVKTLALFGADYTEKTKILAEFGFNDFATGVGLTEFSRARYKNERIPAVFTKGSMRLRSVATAPYIIEPGQLIAGNSQGVQFRNLDGGTLTAGGTLVLQFQARIAGASGNILTNDQSLRLLTPLAGVTVSNAEATPWYSLRGEDEESDEKLRLRNAYKWTLLSAELVGDAYRYIALTGDGSVSAAKVAIDDQNPRGPGTIDVYVSGASGPLGSSDIDALQDLFASKVFYTDDAAHLSASSRVKVISMLPFAVNITGLLYHDSGISGAEATTRVTEALGVFFAAVPIGGFSYGSLTNVITLGDLLKVIEEVEGIRTAVLSVPGAAGVAVPSNELPIAGTLDLTPVAVQD